MASTMLEERASSGNERTKHFKLQLSHRFHDMEKLNSYEVLEDLGRGTFGVVQKARKIKTKRLVALKQLLNHSAKEGFPITAMREITILKRLNHKNILRITDMVYEEPKVSNPKDLIHQRGCFYTVSPYMSSDLVGLLTNPRILISLAAIKCFMMQLLEGVKFIHANNLLHRDIKAANILISNEGILKIGDFGLARPYYGKVPELHGKPGGGIKAYTGLVVTRWYRAPELLLGERKYTTAIDIWGVGCVFAEMFVGGPILLGKTDSHQAQLVFSLVGPPNVLNWKDAVDLPNKTDLNIGLTCKRTLESRFEKDMGKDGVSLLDGLLKVDPYKRLNAVDALEHPYFKNEPLPLQPGELPRFEDSHEIDKERYRKNEEKRDPILFANERSARDNKFPKGPDAYREGTMGRSLSSYSAHYNKRHESAQLAISNRPGRSKVNVPTQMGTVDKVRNPGGSTMPNARGKHQREKSEPESQASKRTFTSLLGDSQPTKGEDSHKKSKS